MKLRYWFAAWTAALALHAAAITLALQSPAPSKGDALDAGETGVDVGLGTLGSYADVSERLAPPVKPVAEPLPEPQQTSQPAPVLATQPAAKTERVINKTEPVIEEKQPQAQAEPDPKTIPEPEPEPQVNATEKPEPSAAPTDPTSQQASAAMVKGSGSADHKRSGGKKGKGKHYINDLMRWLAQHRRYPVDAKQAKQQGTVYLQFLITRDGEVKQHSIYQSSGHALLDSSALEMIVRATPLPAVPDDFYPGRSELPLVIPIEYSLITNSSFKE